MRGTSSSRSFHGVCTVCGNCPGIQPQSQKADTAVAPESMLAFRVEGTTLTTINHLPGSLQVTPPCR